MNNITNLSIIFIFTLFIFSSCTNTSSLKNVEKFKVIDNDFVDLPYNENIFLNDCLKDNKSEIKSIFIKKVNIVADLNNKVNSFNAYIML